MFHVEQGSLRLPMYDVRFGNLARQERGNLAELVRAGCREAVRGRGYKAAAAVWRLAAPKADEVCLCTIRKVSAHCAGILQSCIVLRTSYIGVARRLRRAS